MKHLLRIKYKRYLTMKIRVETDFWGESNWEWNEAKKVDKNNISNMVSNKRLILCDTIPEWLRITSIFPTWWSRSRSSWTLACINFCSFTASCNIELNLTSNSSIKFGKFREIFVNTNIQRALWLIKILKSSYQTTNREYWFISLWEC